MTSGEPVEKTAAPEPVTPEAEAPKEQTETVEPVETKQEAEPVEEELPKGVEKRIAKEVAKQAEFDRKIAEVRSKTLAKQAELEKLTTGTDPAKTESNQAPVEPEAKDGETWGDYQARLKEFRTQEREYLKSEARREAKAELESQRRNEREKSDWDSAVKTHGEKFPEIVTRLAEKLPPNVGLAVRNLENWHSVAVHLEANPGDLAEVLAQFGANDFRGAAALGRIEAKITAPKTTPKPLPEPPAKVGGRSSISAGTVDLERAGMAAFRKAMRPMLAKG